MVTQDAAVAPKLNKVKMKKMKKKKLKQKIKEAEKIDNESEPDKLDLEEKVYPLSHYITDQEELVNQMFTTIRGSKLEAMLPPVLKSIPLKELKKLCLHELRGMSKKRILCSINGQVMEGSSGSEDEEEDKEEPVNEDPKHRETNSKGEKGKPGNEPPSSNSFLHKKIKVEPGLEDTTGSSEGKSVLELLELEMRARIIKTMLEKGDGGKKITEDAIVAVMQSASQITREGVDATVGNKEAANTAKSKNDAKEMESGREIGDEDEAVDERRRGRRSGQGRRAGRRSRHEAAHDGKKDPSTRSQRRGDRSHSGHVSRERSSRRRKESSASDKRAAKKKITRKEFEERMKRAKKNRTYRQRKASEDEEKTKENENQTENTTEDKDEKTEDKPDENPDVQAEGNNSQSKTGEASEKEEGEIDSEEEEGACSPSDVSSASSYSSSRSSSRSMSRSHSRSPSRSPQRTQQRKSRRSGSGRRKGRSHSRSHSKSRTPDRRRSRSDHQQRNLERKRSRESPTKGDNKKDVKKTSPEATSPSREEDWGHKCDIEFVDSEEDFDDNSEGAKESGAQKTLPANRIERASISFSLQKKLVGLTQNVDLDDLPLKKKQLSRMKGDVEPLLETLKATARSEEIVISSDSETESQVSTQKSLTESQASTQKSLRETKADGIKQSRHRHFAISSKSKLDGTKKTDKPSMQADQEEKLIEKVDGSETRNKETSKGVMDESVASKLTNDHHQDTFTAQKSSGKVTQSMSNENTEHRREKQTVKNIDNVDSNVPSNKDGSTDESGDDSESNDESESAPEELNRDTGGRDIPDEDKQFVKGRGMLNKDSAENIDGEPALDGKGRGSDRLSREKMQDVETAESHMSRVDFRQVDDDGSRKRRMEDELHTDSEQNSETEKDIEKKDNIRDDSSNSMSMEEDQRVAETSDSKQRVKRRHFKEKGVDIQAKDASVWYETEEKEKNEKSKKRKFVPISEPKSAEPDSKDAGSVFEEKSEEEEAEKIQLCEDDKGSEDMKGLGKAKTPAEPAKMETRLTRSRVKSSQKFEMVMPDRSWLKKNRKKREKVKDAEVIERDSSLQSVESDGVQSSSKASELETQINQSMTAVKAIENEEAAVHSPTLVSDTQNTQPVEDVEGKKPTCASPEPDPSEIPPTEDKTLRKMDHNTEIIGVIETSKGTSDTLDDMELGGSSWSMRWLQSEKVQKVVTSSKMLSRVRKKIQRKEKATKVVMAERVEETQKPADPVMSVIGSIEEYERLFGTKVKKDEAPITAGGEGFQESVEEGQVSGSGLQVVQGDIAEPVNIGNPVFGSDDDGEDSEDEALWSKIIKK